MDAKLPSLKVSDRAIEGEFIVAPHDRLLDGRMPNPLVVLLGYHSRSTARWQDYPLAQRAPVVQVAVLLLAKKLNQWPESPMKESTEQFGVLLPLS